MAEQDIDELQRAADERVELARQAEFDLMEQLQNRGLVELWNVTKAGLHCERFIQSRTGKSVVDRLMRSVCEAQLEWLNAEDPSAPAVLAAHKRAQAAHMALFAIDEVLQDAKEAQAELERIQRDLNDEPGS